MWQRWRQVVFLGAGLSAISLVARLATRLWTGDDVGRQELLGWLGYGAVALTLAVVAFRWARLRPMGRVALDLAGGALIGLLFSALVGPFISGGTPFDQGAGVFFGMIWLYAGVAIGASVLGLLLVTAIGKDYRSQALKRFAEAERGKPRRVARR